MTDRDPSAEADKRETEFYLKLAAMAVGGDDRAASYARLKREISPIFVKWLQAEITRETLPADTVYAVFRVVFEMVVTQLALVQHSTAATAEDVAKMADVLVEMLDGVNEDVADKLALLQAPEARSADPTD